MEWYEAGALLLGMIIAGMAIGLPVAFSFLLTNVIGIFVFSGGWPVMSRIVQDATNLLTTFTLLPIPMFILMGALFFQTGLAARVFDALDKLLGRLPGRLCFLTVMGGSLFSTLTGSSMANTAMLGSRMAMGPILGTGGLAMIIPPSNLAVLLASVANIDVGRLLVAGLIPGFLLAGLYVAMISLQLWRNPTSAPSYDVPRTTAAEKIRSICVNLLPMALIVVMVVGFIILGITTPSEAACFGVLGVIILATAFRCLSRVAIRESLLSTIKTGGLVFFILMNSTVFSQLLAMSGASGGLIGWATAFQVSPFIILAAMFVILIALGMFMDPVSMILITAPIFFPLAVSFGFDPIWFAIIVLMSLEMSQTTPPFGLLLYIMLGMVRKTTLFEVASAAAPFLLCDLILVMLLVAFPTLALYLPRLMT